MNSFIKRTIAAGMIFSMVSVLKKFTTACTKDTVTATDI